MTTQKETGVQAAYKIEKKEEPINWLDAWGVTKDKAINSKIVEIQEGLEVYIRGWLELQNRKTKEKNRENEKNGLAALPIFTIETLEFTPIQEGNGSGSAFTINVFLNPPVKRPPHLEEGEEDDEIGGSHLIPPPPPPPGKGG